MIKAVALVVFFKLASADLIQIQSDITALMSNASSMRAVSVASMIGEALFNVNRYGCWCFFEADHGLGRGQPQDWVDGNCKVLANGYDCAIIDVREALNEKCEPWSVRYISGISQGRSQLYNECHAHNTEICKIYSCMVEGLFSFSMFESLSMIATINPLMRESNGFKRGETCVTGGPTERSETKCCGEYPQRYTYRTRDSNARVCCGDKVVSTVHFDCCDGERPISVGIGC